MAHLRRYMERAIASSPDHPILVDKFLDMAIEVDVDAVCDGERVVIGGVMEHIEMAGVHSGDSACSIPPWSLPEKVLAEIRRATRALALELGVLRPDERAVRRGRQRRLRPRGKPARVENRPVRIKSDWRPARQSRRARDGRRDSRPARLHRRSDPALHVGERGSVPLHQVHGRGHRARPRDEVDGRGDGHRPRVRHRFRESPRGRRQPVAEERLRVHQRPRRGPPRSREDRARHHQRRPHAHGDSRHGRISCTSSASSARPSTKSATAHRTAWMPSAGARSPA